jgi:hypothetical protein
MYTYLDYDEHGGIAEADEHFARKLQAECGPTVGAMKRVIGRARREVREQFRQLWETSTAVTHEMTHRIWQLEEERKRLRRRREQPPAPVGEPPLTVLCDLVTYPITIYGLTSKSDPRRVRYVGQSLNPVGRFNSHVTKGAPNVSRWCDELRASGDAPQMVLIDSVPREFSDDREWHWIGWYRERGMADLNHWVPRQEAVA